MQEEIIDLLKREKKKMTSAEMAIKIGASVIHVRMSLKKLIKYKEVLFDDMNRIETRKHYETKNIYDPNNIKRGTRLYYLNKERYGV